MIKEYQLQYPRFARQANLTGKVVIWALIDEEGRVIRAEVYKPSGVKAFDEAALAAAYKCRYSPGIQNGRPIKVPVTYSVEFVLDD